MATEKHEMTSGFRARLDLLATLLTIGTCLLVCAVVVLKVTGANAGAGAAVPTVPVGSVLKLPDDLAGNSSDLTVLISLSSKCRFCTDSMPAFRRLNEFMRSNENGRIQILALSLESREAFTAYLQGNALTHFRPTVVKSGSELVRVIARTPTLVLVDGTGKVLASSSGQMTVGQMNHFIRRHFGAGPSG